MLPLFWLWPYTLNTLSWCIAIPVRDYSQQPGRSGVDLQICDDDSINIFVTCSSPATPPFLKSDGGLHPRFPVGALCHYPWMESMVILHMGPLSRVSGSSLFYFLFWHIPPCLCRHKNLPQSLHTQTFGDADPQGPLRTCRCGKYNWGYSHWFFGLLPGLDKPLSDYHGDKVASNITSIYFLSN